MTKPISNKKADRDNSPDKARSIKSPVRSGTVRAKDVEKVVREVVNMRDGTLDPIRPSPMRDGTKQSVRSSPHKSKR